jgi:hypothetical protein
VTATTAPAPTSNFDAYRAACAEAAAQPPSAWAFKSDPRYTRILEHVTPEQGGAFLSRVRDDFPADWDTVHAVLPRLVARNDALGRPTVAPFPEVGLTCSPSNFRYLYHALRVLRHLDRLGLHRVGIFELGGGYGGLALYVFGLAAGTGLHSLAYTTVDVPEAAALQAVYAREADLPVWSVNGLDPAALEAALHAGDGDAVPRYLISAYAFSEFDAETRAWYEHRLVRRCPHGFLVWNFPVPLVGEAEKPLGGPVYPFVDAPLTTEPERPRTGPGNLVVTY